MLEKPDQAGRACSTFLVFTRALNGGPSNCSNFYLEVVLFLSLFSLFLSAFGGHGVMGSENVLA